MKALSANNWHGKSRKSSTKSHWHEEIIFSVIKKIMTYWDREIAIVKSTWNDEEKETVMKETARIQKDSS